jgi:hypothetical protein
VVAEGDPTRDLSALRDVRYTITGGRLVDWAAVDGAFGPRWFSRYEGAGS